MADLLDSILGESATQIEEQPNRLNEQEFAALTAEIDQLRSAIVAGQIISRDDARKIVVWFRARREKNFTVTQAKKAKASKEKAAAKPRAARKKLSTEEQQALAASILAGL